MARSAMLVTLLGASVLLAGCTPAADEEEQPSTAEVNNMAAQRPALPIAEPPLDRSGLLLAAARAASAAALGADDAEAQRALEGDPFEVRIRFGCPGAGGAAASGPFSARFEPETRTLRLNAAPDLSLGEPWIAQLAGQGVEAVEGFWMHRPWLLQPGCPAVPAAARAPAEEQEERPERDADAPDPAAAAVPAAQRVGIARFFTEADPRTGRRDSRGYEATVTLAEGKQPSPQGYDLVLAGRLRPLPGGRVIACRVERMDAPPDCVIAAEFDRVRIERADTAEMLAKWGGG